MSADCKYGEVGCGQYYDCGRCKAEKHKRIWRNMTEAERNYDRHVDPLGAYTSGLSAPGGDREVWSDRDEARGCSCHINAPCSFCCPDDPTTTALRKGEG